MNKSIINLTMVICSLSILNGQNSLEKQLREIDELRSKLKGLKSDETPVKKKLLRLHLGLSFNSLGRCK